MKKSLQISLALLIAFSLIASQALAQSPVTPGPVWVVQYLKIKPGKSADFVKWMTEYRSRVMLETKKAELIVDYKVFTKPTGDNSSGDWDVAEAVIYRNYAEALDTASEETRKKQQEIQIKVFGSVENGNKVRAELRDPSREVVASRLMNEMTLNPVK
jgi:hypothetical protein